MRSRAACRVVPLSLLILAGVGPGLRPCRAQAQATARPAPSADEAAIRAADEAFVRAYNAGDAKALAAMFTDDAEVFEADGARYRGRDLIERRFAETFAEAKGAKITIEPATFRLLAPDVAREEGVTVVTPADAPPIRRFFTVLSVKRDGRWLMADVREEDEPVVPPRERIRELAWLVGDWVDESSDAEIRVHCRWSEDGSYLLRDLAVRRAGKVVLSVHQRVAWDPVAGAFRSWEFDTEGGFGEGRWSRDGDRWVVKETGVRPEGVTSSSTRVTVRERPDMLRWTLSERVLGGDAVPGEETSVLTRIPPAPRFGAPAAPAAPATAPNTERSPR